MKTNQDYKNAALDRLRGNWTPAVVATLVYALAAMLCSSNEFLVTSLKLSTGTSFAVTGLCSLVAIFVVNPLQVGYANSVRRMFDHGDYALTGNMFSLSLSGYLHKVAGMFLMLLKVFLWMLLLFIPGLIMSYAYAMTPYILEDYPEIDAWDASTRSRKMMKGHKFDLFCLQLRFIGWILLGVLTCGIGLLWVIPYMTAAETAFYNDLKAEWAD